MVPSPMPSLLGFASPLLPLWLLHPALFIPGSSYTSWCFKIFLTVSDAVHFLPSFSPISPMSLSPKAPETRHQPKKRRSYL